MARPLSARTENLRFVCNKGHRHRSDSARRRCDPQELKIVRVAVAGRTFALPEGFFDPAAVTRLALLGNVATPESYPVLREAQLAALGWSEAQLEALGLS
jgi:hypothetical protein